MDKENLPPITTATVARLYAEQGKLDRAEELYRVLLQVDPEDPRIAQGLDQIRQLREAAGQPIQGDRVEVVVLEQQVTCRWVVTSEGLRRARLVLGEEGQLALRVVGFPARDDSAEQTGPVSGDEGEVSRPLPRGAAMVAAAIGLSAGSGRFVSIAHCGAVPAATSAE